MKNAFKEFVYESLAPSKRIAAAMKRATKAADRSISFWGKGGTPYSPTAKSVEKRTKELTDDELVSLFDAEDYNKIKGKRARTPRELQLKLIAREAKRRNLTLS